MYLLIVKLNGCIINKYDLKKETTALVLHKKKAYPINRVDPLNNYETVKNSTLSKKMNIIHTIDHVKSFR